MSVIENKKEESYWIVMATKCYQVWAKIVIFFEVTLRLDTLDTADAPNLDRQLLELLGVLKSSSLLVPIYIDQNGNC